MSWKSQRQSVITRPIVILGFVSLFTDMASEMLYPVMPIFLTAVLGASMFQLGLIEGVAEALASILKAYFGSISDSKGRRSIFVVVGYNLSAFCKVLPGFWQMISVVVVARLGDRLGKAIRTAPRDALLASYSAADSQGSVFGFHRAMDTFGAALGPALAIIYLWFRPGHYAELFLVAFAPSCISSLLTLFVKDPVELVATESRLSFLAAQVSCLRQGGASFRRLLLAVALFAIVNSSDVFLIMKAREIGLSDTSAIGAYVFYNLVYAVLAYPLGRLSDRIGKKKAYVSGLLVYSLSYMGFASTGSALAIWISFALYGFYAAATESIVKAWVAEICPAELRGSSFGLLTSIMSIGALVSSCVAGFLWESAGSSIPFYLAASGAFISIFLLPRYRFE